MLYVTNACPEVPEGASGLDLSCTAAAKSGMKTVLNIGAGETRWLFVDGTGYKGEGAYAISISEPCVASCAGKVCGLNACGDSCGTCDGGDLCDSSGACAPPDSVDGNTCSNPLIVDELPFLGMGDVQNATAIYTPGSGSCPESLFGPQSTEQVWQLDVPAAGTYAVAATPTSAGDVPFPLAVYVMDACPDTDPPGGNVTAPCVDGIIGGTLYVELSAGTSFIVVDGGVPTGPDFPPLPPGLEFPSAYALAVELCTGCTGKACKAAGCGG